MITPEAIQEKLEDYDLMGFFTKESVDVLARFTRRMLEINEELNLTHFCADFEVLDFHILDSAQALPVIQKRMKRPEESWMDLGSGCGFPGVVLAAAFSGMDLTLMDSINKKVLALKTCAESAGMNVKTISGRAEEMGRDPVYRETLDGVSARAVADFPILLEYAVPLLKPGGYLVNWMTESQVQFVDKYQHALDELKSKIVEKTPYFLLGGTQKRFLVIVEKMGKTPSRYPRAPGVPAKKPL